jgi:hypothetical protein
VSPSARRRRLAPCPVDSNAGVSESLYGGDLRLVSDGKEEGCENSEFVSSSKLELKAYFSFLHFDTGKDNPEFYLKTFRFISLKC